MVSVVLFVLPLVVVITLSTDLLWASTKDSKSKPAERSS